MFTAITPEKIATLAVAFVVLVLLLAVGLYILGGLFSARSLIWREFSAYFLSPIAYVVLVVFLAFTGYLFYQTLQQLTAQGPHGVEWPLQMMLGDERFWLVFLFIPPLLTMRLFAEERSTGTLEMLMTAPLKDWQVVLSKFAACFAFYVLMWVPTLAYLPVLLDLHDWQADFQNVWSIWSYLLVGGLAGIVVAVLLSLLPVGAWGRVAALVLLVAGLACTGVGAAFHYQPPEAVAAEIRTDTNKAKAEPPKHLVDVEANIDPMPVLSSYLGLAFVGAMFLSLGLLVSSLVRSQMVAALLSLVLSLLFIVGGFWRSDTGSGSLGDRLVSFFSVPIHFSRDFSRGIVDTRHLVLYASVTVVCLFLTVRSLESRRWR